jgi:hypothetical protein
MVAVTSKNSEAILYTQVPETSVMIYKPLEGFSSNGKIEPRTFVAKLLCVTNSLERNQS